MLYTPEEQQRLRAWVDAAPRQLKQAQARQWRDAQAGFKKLHGYRYKRCRRSVRDRRDEAEFRAEQDRLARLHGAEARGIELLWRKLKYEWLPLSAYLSAEALREAVDEIIANYGSKYRLTFA